MDFVNEGLERLADKVSMDDVKGLRDIVGSELKGLSAGELKDYIECKDGAFCGRKGVSESPRSRQIAINRIREWAGLGTSKVAYQKSLEEYPVFRD